MQRAGLEVMQCQLSTSREAGDWLGGCRLPGSFSPFGQAERGERESRVSLVQPIHPSM